MVRYYRPRTSLVEGGSVCVLDMIRRSGGVVRKGGGGELNFQLKDQRKLNKQLRMFQRV